jgi:GntR family transcriptional regulator
MLSWLILTVDEMRSIRLQATHPSELNLILDGSSFVPYYEQIVEQVRSLVKRGQLREGDTFCSEGEVARFLRISKMPVRQAFQKLRSEGLLTIEKGKRPTIGSGRMPWDFQQLRGFSEEMKRRGLTPSAKTLDLEVVDAPPEVTLALRLSSADKVYRLKRLRYVNGGPVAVVTSYLPARVFHGFEQHNLENRSLYSVFENVYNRKLQWAEEVFGAVTADGDTATILETTIGSPMLIVRETTYDIQRLPIEYSVSLLRGDRYTATVVSVRKSSN